MILKKSVSVVLQGTNHVLMNGFFNAWHYFYSCQSQHSYIAILTVTESSNQDLNAEKKTAAQQHDELKLLPCPLLDAVIPHTSSSSSPLPALHIGDAPQKRSRLSSLKAIICQAATLQCGCATVCSDSPQNSNSSEVKASLKTQVMRPFIHL